MHRTLTLPCVAALAALFASCESYRFQAERIATFEAKSDGVACVAAKTHNGDVTYRASAAPGDPFRIIATLTAYGRTQEEADANLEKLAVACDTTDGRMTLGSVFDGPSSVPTSIAFEVDGPAALDLDIETHNGAVTAEGVIGKLGLLSHNGTVRLTDIDGPVEVETHNGRVQLAGSMPDVRATTHNGEIRVSNRRAGPVGGYLETHNGGIEVELDGGASVALQATTRNGSLRFPAAARIDSRSEHRLEAVLGAGEGRLEAHTHNGGVEVRTGNGAR